MSSLNSNDAMSYANDHFTGYLQVNSSSHMQIPFYMVSMTHGNET